jgi:NTP pyrophosphatase (non-canonical NTP hydrolase)
MIDPNKLTALMEIVIEKNRVDQLGDWSNGSSTYFNALKQELDEVADEVASGRRCYLEDELGDVLWDYLNFLLCLEKEEKINFDRVFERVIDKFKERVEGITHGESWDDIKARQKLRLAQEYKKQ